MPPRAENDRKWALKNKLEDQTITRHLKRNVTGISRQASVGASHHQTSCHPDRGGEVHASFSVRAA